jgi:hypothetical protein
MAGPHRTKVANAREVVHNSFEIAEYHAHPSDRWEEAVRSLTNAT